MPHPPDDRCLRLVLVEDNAIYRDLLVQRLDDLTCVDIVHTADRSADAVSWLADNPAAWDLLVLDIFLTEGHGYEVLKAAGSRAENQHAVFLTSYTRDPARAQALALGADAVFDKLNVDAFLQYVQQRRDALAHADCR
jgi:CheY-like chemotaxis protein